MELKVKTAPKHEPVTLVLAKEYLRVTHDLEDGIIKSMISGARILCEDFARRSISTQTMEGVFNLPKVTGDAFGMTTRVSGGDNLYDKLRIPKGPIQSITSVDLVKTDGTTEEFTDYTFNTFDECIYWSDKSKLISTDYSNLVVTYVCGYSKQSIPHDITEAILITLSDLYYNRDQSNGLPSKARIMLSAHRAKAMNR